MRHTTTATILLAACLSLQAGAAATPCTGPLGPACDTVAAEGLRRGAALISAIEEHLSPAADMTAAVRRNPALHAGAFAGDLTQASVGFALRSEEVAERMAAGDGEVSGSFAAESYRRLRHGGAVWGEAGYSRGTVRNVVWRSSADYDVVFPYITADSIGGDLFSEEYTFGGGYGRRGRRAAWGIEGGVRALHEWRTVDPRPRSIAIDLDFRAGAALRAGRYMAGASFAAKVYKQTGDVDFYNPLGVKGEYHLSGLGAHFARFTGVDAGSLYRGGGYAAMLTLAPADAGEGLYLSLEYVRQRVEKILVAYNNLPLQRIVPQSVSFGAAWTARSGAVRWGAALRAQYDSRVGTESVVGEKISNIYAVLAHLKMYGYSLATVRAEAFAGRGAWCLVPWAEYRGMDEEYVYPAQSRRTDRVAGGADMVFTRGSERMWLRLSAGGGYDAVLQGSLALPVADIEAAIVEMVRHDFARMSLGAAEAHVSLRADRVLRRGVGIFAAGCYSLRRWNDGTLSHAAALSVGIAF